MRQFVVKDGLGHSLLSLINAILILNYNLLLRTVASPLVFEQGKWGVHFLLMFDFSLLSLLLN